MSHQLDLDCAGWPNPLGRACGCPSCSPPPRVTAMAVQAVGHSSRASLDFKLKLKKGRRSGIDFNLKIQDLAPTTAPPLRHWLSSERSLRTPIFGNFLFLLFFNMEQGASLKLPSKGRIRCKPSARFGCELQRLVGSWGLADSRLTPPPPPPFFSPAAAPISVRSFRARGDFELMLEIHAGDAIALFFFQALRMGQGHRAYVSSTWMNREQTGTSF